MVQVCTGTRAATRSGAHLQPLPGLMYSRGNDGELCVSVLVQGMDASMFQGEHFINSAGEKLRREDILSTESRNGREVLTFPSAWSKSQRTSFI